jgi:XTP/dITP diphosphohydrolase
MNNWFQTTILCAYSFSEYELRVSLQRSTTPRYDINMKKIVFATSNPNKIREVNEMLGDKFQIIGLKDIGCTEEVPETQDTIKGNALQKARYVKEHYSVDCFSEDTGLEIDALDGAPGVYTARFGGPERSADKNMARVQTELADKANRGGQFKTVIALVLNGEEHVFTGIARGTMRKEKSGEGGFGYDPIFEPDGYDITFAEMDSKEKNKISHRGQAVRDLIEFLEAD